MLSDGAISLIKATSKGGKVDLKDSDANSIAENYGNNPMMLSIIGQAIKTGVMSIEQAKSSTGLSKAAATNAVGQVSGLMYHHSLEY